MKTLNSHHLHASYPITTDKESPPFQDSPINSFRPGGLTRRFIHRLLLLIESRMDDPELSIGQVAKGLHVSTMQLYRKVKRFTGVSPNQFIRTIRLHRGRHLLLSTDLNVSEIAYAVGFNDPNYFTRSFTQEFNLSPTRYRSRH